MPLSRYLEILDEREQGVNLPPGHVPSTFLFGFEGDRIVGRVSIRHVLNDFLLRVGGHIGYAVLPEFRRRGTPRRSFASPLNSPTTRYASTVCS